MRSLALSLVLLCACDATDPHDALPEGAADPVAPADPAVTAPADPETHPSTGTPRRAVGKVAVVDVADLVIVGWFDDGGDPDGPRVGEALALGDLDGDGHPDIAVGAVGYDAGQDDVGQVYVVDPEQAPVTCDTSVPDLPTCRLEDDFSEYAAVLHGPGAGSNFGSPMTAVDLDGDTFEDLVIGAPGLDVVHIYYGRAEPTDWTAPDTVIAGVSGTQTGAALAAVRDLDGDGCVDLAVGAPGFDGPQPDLGAVYVFFGRDAGSGCERLPSRLDLAVYGFDLRLVGVALGDEAGIAVADAGDFDGDGLHDLLIGAPHRVFDGAEGQAYLLYGTDFRAACAPPCRTSLADVGSAAAWAGLSFVGENDGDWLGVKAVGDLDLTGDGCDDIVLSAKNRDHPVSGLAAVGAAYVVAGDCTSRWSSDDAVALNGPGDGAPDYAAMFHGDQHQDYLAMDLSGAGDFDGDGVDDLLIGEYRDNEADPTDCDVHQEDPWCEVNSGAAYLVYGGDPRFDATAPAVVELGRTVCEGGAWPEGVPEHLKIYGEQEKDIFGKFVSGGRDLDGDGRDDVVVSAPRWDWLDNDCNPSPSCGAMCGCDKGKVYVIQAEEPGCHDGP